MEGEREGRGNGNAKGQGQGERYLNVLFEGVAPLEALVAEDLGVFLRHVFAEGVTAAIGAVREVVELTVARHGVLPLC